MKKYIFLNYIKNRGKRVIIKKRLTGWKSKRGEGDGWPEGTPMLPGSTWYMAWGRGMPGTVGDPNLCNMFYIIIIIVFISSIVSNACVLWVNMTTYCIQ